MALITKVKAGSVSSLSDARYFAAMGVDWLGFDVNPNSESYVSPELYKNIAGWVAGPKRVIEISGGQVNHVDQLIEDYSPDAIQVNSPTFPLWFPNTNTNTITTFVVVSLETFSSAQFIELGNKPDYLVFDFGAHDPIHYIEMLEPLSKVTKLLLSVAPQIKNIATLTSRLPIAGLSLKGSRELAVGLKEYNYSELLEQLELY